MEAHAEGLEARPHRAEVLATCARQGSVNLKESLKNIDTLGMRAVKNQNSFESVTPGIPGCWHARRDHSLQVGARKCTFGELERRQLHEPNLPQSTTGWATVPRLQEPAGSAGSGDHCNRGRNCHGVKCRNSGQPHFKDASDLSRAQKCTALLPILLARRDNPLIIDQPEENLDNHFIFETVVNTVQRTKKLVGSRTGAVAP